VSDSGSVRVRNRAVTFPSADSTNFSKFRSVPGLALAVRGAGEQLVERMPAGPLTSTFSGERERDAVVDRAERMAIVGGAGFLAPNWLHGTPSTVKPRSWYRSCNRSRLRILRVNPHSDATFTIQCGPAFQRGEGHRPVVERADQDVIQAMTAI
jgi:hypothetical protein